MASSDLLRVGRGELQAHAVQVRGLAGQMDQTIAQTEQRIQALLDSLVRPGGRRLRRPLRRLAPGRPDLSRLADGGRRPPGEVGPVQRRPRSGRGRRAAHPVSGPALGQDGAEARP